MIHRTIDWVEETDVLHCRHLCLLSRSGVIFLDGLLEVIEHTDYIQKLAPVVSVDCAAFTAKMFDSILKVAP